MLLSWPLNMGTSHAFLRRILSLCIALALVLGMLPYASATEPIAEIDVSKLGDSIGTLEYDSTYGELFVYYAEIDGSTYNEARILPQVMDDATWPTFANPGTTTKNNCCTTTGSTISVNNAAYESAVSEYTRLSDSITFSSPISADSDADYLLICLKSGSVLKKVPRAFLIVKWTRAKEADKTDLAQAINEGLNCTSDAYYTSNDRYNGKDISESGFWADFQSLLSSAQSVNSDASALQARVDQAAAALRAAIDNLIPTTQVNATALYEALQTYSGTLYSDAAYYSAVSWPAFSAARTEAQALLSSLFDAEGNATAANKAEQQDDLDAAISALAAAAVALDQRVNSYQQADSENALAGIRIYAERYDPSKLEQSAYTPESWSAFTAARDAALEVLGTNGTFYATMGQSELRAQTDAFQTLREACHGLTQTKSSIQVHVSVVDNYSLRSGAVSTLTTTWTQTLTLSPGATVGQVMDQLNVVNLGAKWNAGAGIYLNGLFYYYVAQSGLNSGIGYGLATQYRNAKLQDGDTLVIAQMEVPTGKNISEVISTLAPNAVLDYIRYQTLEVDGLTVGEDGVYEVQAGQSFTVTASTSAAMPTLYDGVNTPTAGLTICTSTAAETLDAAANSPAATAAGAVTGVDGTAAVTLYAEGYVALNAYNLGEYGGLTNGPSVLIHVLPASELKEIKAQLKAELKAAAEDPDYPETFCTADKWAEINKAYTDGLAAVDAAADSGAARVAQLVYLNKILAAQEYSASFNTTNLNTFRKLLAQLPDDLELLDASAETTVKSLVARYQAMTAYQLQQLTQLEKDTYDAVKAKYDEGLPEAKAYSLHVAYDFSGVPETDRAGLETMIAWLRTNTANEGQRDVLGGVKMAELYSFNTTANAGTYGSTAFTPIAQAYGGTEVSFCASPEYASHALIRGQRTYDVNGQKYGTEITDSDYVLSGEEGGWTITDTSTAEVTSMTFTLNASRIYTVNGNSYEMRGVVVEGLEESGLTSTKYGFFDFSDYLGKSPDNMTFISIRDSFLQFVMPYSDVTFTIVWTPVGGTQAEIAAAKESAKAAIDAAYAAYSATDYTDDNWLLLTRTRTEGRANVDAAASLSAVTEARKAAIAAMAAVKSNSGSDTADLPDMGATVGRVYISVRNDTYPGADLTGELLAGWYDMCQRDSMMTVMLKALQAAGYAWSGTGGSSNADSQYDISYLSRIYIDENENGKLDSGEKQLGEMDGAAGSGWMGTLNDWFTNEGFNAFSVANGKLENNDVISIVFTQNLGVDVGGTWGNADTSLTDLNITVNSADAVLSPGFESDILEYALIIPSERANVVITPTAANKNYLVKTFLNIYNSDTAFYKRTETISVTAGDVIYVGCGEPSWPSMNNQGDEVIPYSATKYIIRVYTADAGGIQARINSLPDASKLTLSNYESYVVTVKQLRADYNALADKTGVDISRLTAVEDKIASFDRITRVKALLAALPDASEVTSADEAEIKAAQEAYDALLIAEKAWLSSAEINRLNAAKAALQAGSEADLAAARSVQDKIEAIGTITPESETAITEARVAYNKLTGAQKGYVVNYETLTNAEAALTVVKQIAAIGTVTLESETAITAARSAYNALNGAQKALVSNTAALTNAEAALANLKNPSGGDTTGYANILQQTLVYLGTTVTNPIVGSTNGEWAVLDQARAGTLSSEARQNYLENLKEYTDRLGGKLDETTKQVKHTEYERVILALTSLGVDASKFVANQDTYDLVAPLLDKSTGVYEYQVSEQGNNGTIFALIALDSGNYLKTTEGNAVRASWIDTLINKQLSNGSWPIYNADQSGEGSGEFASGSDTDITAMAVQALAPYYLSQSKFSALGATSSYAQLKQTVDSALDYLSSVQNQSGGFGSAEASAQVVVALSALGRDAATDPDFTKNGTSVLGDLLGYYVESTGGFRHLMASEINQMATEQAAYALVAYDRYTKGQSTLYDMTDVFSGSSNITHTVTAAAGVGGSIDPSGKITVRDGESVTFTITPGAGFQIKDILVDGQSVWAGSAAYSLLSLMADDLVLVSPWEAEDVTEHQHEAVYVAEVAATCLETGHAAYWRCETCAESFVDQDCTIPLDEIPELPVDPANHVDDEILLGQRAATCTVSGYTGDVLCGGCGTELQAGSVIEPISHQYGDDWYADETGHWHVCEVCGAKNEVIEHTLTTVETEPAACPDCGYVPGTDEDEAKHTHTGGTATCTALAVCGTCGLPYGDYDAHQYTEWEYSSGLHWKACAGCGLADVTTLEAHEWVPDPTRSIADSEIDICAFCEAEKAESIAATVETVQQAPTVQAPTVQAAAARIAATPSTGTTYTLSNVTADRTVYVTFAPVSPVIEQDVSTSGYVGTAYITEDAIAEAIQAVNETTANTITIIPGQVSADVDTVVIDLPVAAAKAIVNQTSASVLVSTEKGAVSIPNETLREIARAATGSSIQIIVEEQTVNSVQPLVTEKLGPESAVIEVTVKSGDKTISSFGGENLTVSIPVSDTFEIGQYCKVLVLHSDGTTEILVERCRVDTDNGRCVTVTVDHLSAFVVVDENTGKHAIIASCGTGGSLDPVGEVAVDDGGAVTFWITPDKGYQIADVKVDGVSIGAVESYTFRKVMDDHSIRATFKRGLELPDYGPVIGSVYISVENTTYRGGDFTGTLLSGWYDLCARDTMMTSILKALATEGYSWWGTGGAGGNGPDYDITYLAGIYVDTNGDGYRSNGEPTLAEFSSTSGSGWMGTLNDWFVNEGFQSFRVGGRDDYELVDGDYINVVYTQNLGADVGGSWNNADTSLAGLKISGGKLIPTFNGDTLEYSLTITGTSANVTVTPTAANKNYLVKTFLNNYNSDSACYRRTQSIRVKVGDTIYIGIGEKDWPSMNNQETEAIRYSSTVYVIKVVNSDLQSRIDALPDAAEITCENYIRYIDIVEQLREDYDKLSDQERKKIDETKLLEAEERIKFFSAVDDVKDLLDAIPSEKNLIEADAQKILTKVHVAKQAFEHLTEKQKSYITETDVVKHNAAVSWLESLGYQTDGKITLTPVILPFTDVEGHWAYDAIAYAYINGLFNGTGTATFSPDMPMSRAMLVTVLWRIEGEPSATSPMYFTDVPAGAWYSDAVSWASSTGIVNGTGNGFDPNGDVTREQIATILYRYAKTKGWNINASASLTSFVDGAETSVWASRAMEWACGEKLIVGKDGNRLDSCGQATRAEVATILMRLLER